MSEANEQDKNKAPDFEAIASQIEKKVSEKLNTHSANIEKKFDDLAQKIPAQSADAKAKKKKDDLSFIFGDDENDADAKKIDSEEIVKEAESRAKEVARKTASEVFAEYSQRQALDMKTLEDFPMLNRQSKFFDQEFYNQVTQEMDNRVKSGRNKEDPYLIYDAAAGVKARTSRWNNISQKNLMEEDRRYNNREAGFSVSQSSRESSGKPKEEQLKYAASMGMNKEEVERLQKKYNISF